MNNSLQKRIHNLVHQTLNSYPGAWMIWCDPRGDWAPLLQRVTDDDHMGDFTLVSVPDHTAGQACTEPSRSVGSPCFRGELQTRLDAGETFVLHIQGAPDQLGWLWAHALLAERIYNRSLREQLTDWGWRPHSLTITEDELAVMARQNLQQDPREWGGDGPQPDLLLLAEVLAGFRDPNPDNRLILDPSTGSGHRLTVEGVGLPPLDEPDVSRRVEHCQHPLVLVE